MLLIFFLVTSSMNADKGLMRQLPPPDEQETAQVDIHRSDVLQLRIDASDKLWVDDEPLSPDALQQRVEQFLASRRSEHFVVGVQPSRATTYATYFSVQNTIVAAFKAQRERIALRQFGHPLALCTDEERAVVTRRLPLRISETYPSATEEGGGR